MTGADLVSALRFIRLIFHEPTHQRRAQNSPGCEER